MGRTPLAPSRAPAFDTAAFWPASDEQVAPERAAVGAVDPWLAVVHLSPLPARLTVPWEGRFLDANDRCLTLLGYSRNELVGRSALELKIVGSRAQQVDMAAAVLAEGRLLNYEAEIRTKSGDNRTVLISTRLVARAGVRHNSPC